MRETDYYPEICDKFSKYLSDILGESFKFSFNVQEGNLDTMMGKIEKDLDVTTNTIFYPPLKVDLTCGVKLSNDKIAPILIEVKKSSSLSLMNYSQLSGYLQVARNIGIGILLLVNDGVRSSPLSNDFKHLIDIEQIDFSWLTISTNNEQNTSRFRTGICVYTPGNGIDWVDTEKS